MTAFRAAPAMAALVAERGAECALMHMQGEPRTMQEAPRYGDVVAEVAAFLRERVDFALAAGIERERILIDPGFGFGKTVEHNLELLDRLDELAALGQPILIGTSRKSFLGALTGRREHDRLAATIATNVIGLLRGASVFRVHDVAAVRDALAVAAATVSPQMSEEPDDELDSDDELDLDRGVQTVVTIEISGLSLYTHVGVSAAEREVGQRLLFDIRIDVGESDATETDRLEDTVDYGEVCQLVALVAQQRNYKTLERLCTVVADRIIEDFGAEAVWVKAAKPEPPIPLAVEEVSVEVWRELPE